MSHYELKRDKRSVKPPADRHPQELPSGQCLTPFQRQLLQQNLQSDLPQLYRQRINIMLLADEGKSQTEICQILGCCAATARHWMHIARSEIAHQWQDCPQGRRRVASEAYIEKLQELLSHSPRDYGYSFQRWTVSWLCKHLADEFGVKLSDRHLKRLLKQLGLSTRPQPTTPKQNTPQPSHCAQICINDWKSEQMTDKSDFLLLNFPQHPTEIETHGATSIRTSPVTATTQPNVGLLSPQSRFTVLPVTS